MSLGIPILSFFTGGGFLDMGFEQAGFNVAWTNECNENFADMYEYATSAWRRSRKENSYSPVSNRNKIEKLKSDNILKEAFGKHVSKEFGIIGGPPCPDFSLGGKHNGFDGENGKLTQVFIRLILKLNPTFFLIENVPGLMRVSKHQSVLNDLFSKIESEGYSLDYVILNALEFGIPQDRERIFIVGIRRTFLKSVGLPRIPVGMRGWYTWPTGASAKEIKQLDWPETTPFGRRPKRPLNLPESLMVYPYFCKKNDPEKLPNGKDYFMPHSEKFQEIPEGNRRGMSFKRLHRFRYSPTAWYGNNEVHLHPWKPRRLSVRETLRLQSVPDEYVLPDGYSLTAKFKLVCNGVPYKLAEVVALSVAEFLSQKKSRKVS